MDLEDYKLQQELMGSFFKKVFDENEAFKDKEHFVKLVKALYPVYGVSIQERGTSCSYVEFRKRPKSNLSPSFPIYFEDRLYESICASENATAFQAKYDRYKELLEQAKNDIDKIIAKAKPMSLPYSLLNGKLKIGFKEKAHLLLKESLCKHLRIKEISFKEKVMNPIKREEREEYIRYSTLFAPTPSYELIEDLLCNKEIALKIAQKIYPVEDEYKIADGAYAEELPYLAFNISPKYKDEINENFSAICECFDTLKRAVSLKFEGNAGIKYEDFVPWYNRKAQENPEFLIPLPGWLKDKYSWIDCIKKAIAKNFKKIRKIVWPIYFREIIRKIFNG